MTLGQFIPDSFFNWTLAKSPMNWAIVWVIASLWLLLFHIVVLAWHSINGTQAAIEAGPGQIAMLPDATQAFTVTAANSTTNDLSAFLPGGPTGLSSWGDSAVSRYAEDGWTAN